MKSQWNFNEISSSFSAFFRWNFIKGQFCCSRLLSTQFLYNFIPSAAPRSDGHDELSSKNHFLSLEVTPRYVPLRAALGSSKCEVWRWGSQIWWQTQPTVWTWFSPFFFCHACNKKRSTSGFFPSAWGFKPVRDFVKFHETLWNFIGSIFMKMSDPTPGAASP